MQIAFLACLSIIFCGPPESLFPRCWSVIWSRIFSFVSGTGNIPSWWRQQVTKVMPSSRGPLRVSCGWLKCAGLWWPVPQRSSDEIHLSHCLLLCWFLPLWTSVSSSVKSELALLRALGRSRFRCTPLLPAQSGQYPVTATFLAYQRAVSGSASST